MASRMRRIRSVAGSSKALAGTPPRRISTARRCWSDAMIDCGCPEHHRARRIVLTGGPGAGKTAVLALVKQSLCRHLRVLPEAAGILFGGGFPREANPDALRAAQRAIYFVQRELEAA